MKLRLDIHLCRQGKRDRRSSIEFTYLQNITLDQTKIFFNHTERWRRWLLDRLRIRCTEHQTTTRLRERRPCKNPGWETTKRKHQGWISGRKTTDYKHCGLLETNLPFSVRFHYIKFHCCYCLFSSATRVLVVEENQWCFARRPRHWWQNSPREDAGSHWIENDQLSLAVDFRCYNFWQWLIFSSMIFFLICTAQ